jgi:hypothetical protein
MAWLAHLLVTKAVLRAMALPAGLPWVELAAYTGYSFVPVCVSILAGQLGGRWAYTAAWLYGSLCSAGFLLRTLKRVIWQEMRGARRGVDGGRGGGGSGGPRGAARLRERQGVLARCKARAKLRRVKASWQHRDCVCGSLGPHAGRDVTSVNYLLLGLALFQFPFAFYLGVRP